VRHALRRNVVCREVASQIDGSEERLTGDWFDPGNSDCSSSCHGAFVGDPEKSALTPS